jgi:hypothetical protein
MTGKRPVSAPTGLFASLVSHHGSMTSAEQRVALIEIRSP